MGLAIDDPLEAAEALIASDERQRSPVAGLARNLLDVVKFIPAAQKALEGFTKPAEAIVQWLDHHSQENRDYLVNVLKEEIKQTRGWLEQISDEHRQFLEGDYMALVLDGLKKAENLRSKERIARIAKILAYAANVGPANSVDYTEEMMRVAMDLTDQDVGVLREIDRAQKEILKWSGGMAPMDPVNDSWKNDPPKVEGMTPSAIVSACEKLQSFGLVMRVDRVNTKLNLSVTPYGILQKGHDFIQYIRGCDPVMRCNDVGPI